tara:strand:- start:199 stop:459 length:261 start_codon:yes stop_codon:yes gene_type:complete
VELEELVVPVQMSLPIFQELLYLTVEFMLVVEEDRLLLLQEQEVQEAVVEVQHLTLELELRVQLTLVEVVAAAEVILEEPQVVQES